MRVREPRWARFTRAAVGEAAAGATRTRRERALLHVADIRRRISEAQAAEAGAGANSRPDARLLPAVVGTWAAAGTAVVLPWERAAGTALLITAVFLVGFPASRLWQQLHRGGRAAGSCGLPRQCAVQPPGARGARAARVFKAAVPTLVLTAVCVVAVFSSVALRSWSATTSPLDQAVWRGGPLVLTLEVGGAPRLLNAGNGPKRVAFDAFVLRAAARGQQTAGRMPIRVVAGPAWAGLLPGDRATTAGTIIPAGARERVAGILRPATIPQEVVAAAGGARTAVTAIRSSWVASVQAVWAERSADTAGLLPGMVMGDRSGMDGSLDEAMKTVGLTHLTAVSGANCTLVLASLLLGLRSLRMPRGMAFAASGAGLLGFVMVVGPDPSVLRAAVMGAIGAMAVLGGRPRRVGALLSVSIVVLLLADPWLATDYAFILSVLATLGLHLVGQRCVRWLAVMLPLWLAQAVAIPLAAQLFCAPVIVLLQARLTPYTVPANMLAAPVVALVTTVGTLGMVAAAVVPPLAALCAAAGGAGAWWVACVARTMSALPAASLPWPSGAQGVVLMSVLNAVVLAAFFALVERERASAAAARLARVLPARWRSHGFRLLVVLAAAGAAWWSAAVLQL